MRHFSLPSVHSQWFGPVAMILSEIRENSIFLSSNNSITNLVKCRIDHFPFRCIKSIHDSYIFIMLSSLANEFLMSPERRKFDARQSAPGNILSYGIGEDWGNSAIVFLWRINAVAFLLWSPMSWTLHRSACWWTQQYASRVPFIITWAFNDWSYDLLSRSPITLVSETLESLWFFIAIWPMDSTK